MTITSNISTITVSLLTIGKVTFLDDTEKNIINSKLSQEPWKTAYATLTSDANTWKSKSYSLLPKLFSSNHLFTTKVSGYGGAEDYLQAAELRKVTYALGLKYVFTGDISYADKLIDCIYRWFLDPNTYMKPDQFTSTNPVEDTIHQLGVTISGVYCAAGLIWNYWDMATSIGPDGRQRKTYKDEFISWIGKNVTYAAKTSPFFGYQFCMNKTWSRLALIMSGAIMTNDTTRVNYVIERFKSLMNPDFTPGGGVVGYDGCMRNDAYRTTDGTTTYGGLSYSLLTMNTMTAIAEMAKHYNNTDLFTYSVGGISFKLALDLYTKYGLADSPVLKWKNECCRSKNGYVCSDLDQTVDLLRSRFAFYEIANYRLGDIYKNVINKRGRPMNNSYIFQYDTLMHGT